MHLDNLYVGFCTLLIFTLNLSISSYKFLDSTVIKDLVISEAKLLKSLQDYVVAEQEKLNSLKLKVLEFEKENLKAINKDLNYFLNPLVAFILTRRLVVDWIEIEKYITKSKFLNYVHFYKNMTNFPTRKVLDNVASAFLNLQNFYNLETTSIANGEINNVYYNTSLTTRDCFELGHTAYRNSNLYYTILWLEQAYFQINDENETEMEEEILRTLAQSYFSIGDIESALEMTKELLIIKPDDLNAKSNKEIYNKILKMDSAEDRNEYLYKARNNLEELKEHKYEEYEELCRHEYERSPKILSSLHCRYLDSNNKFLKIAPFKQEILNLEPFVCVFHDVLYDGEIGIIRQTVGTNFVDAAEFDFDTQQDVLSERRTSKLAEFADEELSNYAVLEQRTSDMTGLIMKPHEGLNVQKYEIGGKYVPHFDYLQTDSDSTYQRTATLIFYMNDAEQGGNTVFPQIGVNVSPRKGSALFWYNTHSSGELDIRSLHAGCPVLVGPKWIATYWMQEGPQIFTRPCTNSSRAPSDFLILGNSIYL